MLTLKKIESALREAGIEDSLFEALILTEAFSKKSRAALLSDRDLEMDVPELEAALERRIKREPLQYIIGSWEFMGCTFKVSKNCLIPRPDTEILCEAAISEINSMGGKAKFADLCTGSGCIAVAVLKNCPDSTCDAVELIPETARIAKENAEINGVDDRINVITGDVRLSAGGDGYALITANPPYITADEMLTLEPELAFEPRVALTDEGDGLSVIRAIIENYPQKLLPSGKLMIEMGASQGDAVSKIAGELGFSCRIIKDLGGNDRVAVITRDEYNK